MVRPPCPTNRQNLGMKCDGSVASPEVVNRFCIWTGVSNRQGRVNARQTNGQRDQHEDEKADFVGANNASWYVRGLNKTWKSKFQDWCLKLPWPVCATAPAAFCQNQSGARNVPELIGLSGTNLAIARVAAARARPRRRRRDLWVDLWVKLSIGKTREVLRIAQCARRVYFSFVFK